MTSTNNIITIRAELYKPPKDDVSILLRYEYEDGTVAQFRNPIYLMKSSGLKGFPTDDATVSFVSEFLSDEAKKHGIEAEVCKIPTRWGIYLLV